jgi:hypothetical protein
VHGIAIFWMWLESISSFIPARVSPCVPQVTGNATTTDAQSYAESGFTDTLGKPFTLEALRGVLTRYLEDGAATCV